MFVLCCVCFFFFFKQKTAYVVRISDWSSDVCSSDLVRDAVEHYLLTAEKNNVQALFLIAGGGGGGASGQNTGQGYINLVHWDDRPGPDNSADAIAQRARKALSGLRDAQIYALVPGAVRGLGDTSGFTVELQNRSGLSRDDFAARSEEHTSELQSLMRIS